MESVIILLLVVLIAAVGIGVVVVLKKVQQTQVAAPLDTDAIARTVQTAINLDAISTSVRGAVEAQMLTTAQQALAANNDQAQQQANQTLTGQSQALDQQTKILLQPFEERMKQLTDSVTALQGSYTAEQATVVALTNQITTLQESTTTLKNALKSPTARGSWGENQLRNVIRMAGMENYCDFTEQFTGGVGERDQRPDVVVNLPSGARLAVDSKAPLAAYLRMQESTDVAVQEQELKQHAKDIRTHVKTLAEKKYWDQFGHATPDFVIMFIPGEGFVADAMKADTALLDDAMKQRVLIASPVNLLGLLLTISKGWQAHSLAEHAEMVANLGVEVYERVGIVIDEMNKMGKNLGTANTAYNDMVASFERRLLVTLRKFKDLGVVQSEIKDVKSIETASPREINVAEGRQELPAPQSKELDS
jgi:DNA recombination protein RmuC